MEAMKSPLLSYTEAAEQVHRFMRALAAETQIPPGVEPATSAASALSRPAEIVPLLAALGRVLAQGIRADRDQPPFPRSTRDGFACRAAEASTNQYLFLSGHVRAGETASGVLGTGEVWEIMTGAPAPEGADAVFMVEHSERSSNPSSDFVRLVAPRTVGPGENIVARGAEAHAGDLLVPHGVRLGPSQIAIAAQCGYGELAVAPRPRVAILSTGDELVPVEGVPGPSQIRNSNSSMLAALVAAAGAEPVILPSVPDQDAPLDAAISNAISADLLLITGGISAGRFDLVEDALARAGARFFFGGVAIQPGKPVTFGQLPRLGQLPLPFFALPGNPLSSAVTFHIFAAPLLAALADDSTPLPRFALAQLTTEWRGKPGLTRFLPSWCDFGLAPEVKILPWHGSGDIATFARSNCFLVVPPEATEITEGSIVQILQI